MFTILAVEMHNDVQSLFLRLRLTAKKKCLVNFEFDRYR